MVVFDVESFKTINYVPYSDCIIRLSKISVKYNRDITENGYEKCEIECVVFEGLNNFNEKLDYVLQIKGEPKKLIIKLLNKMDT